HRKTMLIKNDGCAKWIGSLHEDLDPTRQLDVHLIEGIDRCHLSTPDRAADNAKRNVVIATKQADEEPEDPRSYWNLANSHFGVSDYPRAIEGFTTFLALSQSDDEKYLAHERLADCYKGLDQRED